MPRVTGGDALIAQQRALASPEAIRSIGAALKAGAERIEVYAARSLEEGSVGGAQHVPSAPGTPPNSDSQDLQKSIETVQVEPLRVEVSANTAYAAAQEFGNSRLPARPYMRPAVAAERDKVRELVQNAVTRIARGGRIR